MDKTGCAATGRVGDEISEMPVLGHTLKQTGPKVLSVFGTRPDVIKFLPILKELERRAGVTPVNVLTSQHVDLVRPLLDSWKIRVDHDLNVMVPGQTLNGLMARVISRIDPVFVTEAPDIVLVQGDTTSALSASIAAWQRGIPVGHIEAGLRSGMRDSPFPEELNRRLITKIASLHFAPTKRNVAALRAENVPKEQIECSGNPIVDAIGMIRDRQAPSAKISALLEGFKRQRLIVMTTHRRESFGEVMRERLRILGRFVETRPDIHLLFPVHANPEVEAIAAEELSGKSRVHLLPPLDYPDFLHCLAAAWLVVSDSGGVQEEAPTLGKPLLIIRPNTERPEVVECNVARMAGDSPQQLLEELQIAEKPNSWASRVRPIANPFGQGDSAKRIVNTILDRRGSLGGDATQEMLESLTGS